MAASELELSVVIPSYNSADWLPTTLEALAIALDRSGMRAEVVVIDDGSTDPTVRVLDEIARGYRFPLRVVTQRNGGRFLARVRGLREAAADWVMLLDSRILMHPDSIAHVARVVADDPAATIWNGHAVTDPASPLVGQFWEVPTHVFWGGYLAMPRPMTITPENFDRVPKGTTVFLVPRDVFLAASERHWPDGNAALSNDDTKILREIVDHHPVRLDPGFAV
ncbi:glycosyltransferase family 2 protein, partial [Pseudolysinimonas sp.]|uniref:glycosyltransferase family 2 protein n=1 Tax=Pseudolysinimonas sp. TaxID=2680009 RepID=UPI003784FAA7